MPTDTDRKPTLAELREAANQADLEYHRVFAQRQACDRAQAEAWQQETEAFRVLTHAQLALQNALAHRPYAEE